MKWALADAGLSPEAVGYINAHGTGTILTMQRKQRPFDRVAALMPISCW